MKKYFVVLMFISAILSCSKSEGKKGEEQEELSEYIDSLICGFTFKYQRIYENDPDCLAALEYAADRMEHISSIVPSDKLNLLKGSPIWLEKDVSSGARYHTSAEWLVENGLSADKVNCVEVGNFVNFVDWGKAHKPLTLLHELTHLYHHQVLSYTRQDIIDAYNNAKSSGKYLNVDYKGLSGSIYEVDEAYALTNEKEYLAEGTESYFDGNDYYPFTNAQLKEYDPELYAILEDIWGERE